MRFAQHFLQRPDGWHNDGSLLILQGSAVLDAYVPEPTQQELQVR